MILAAAFMLAVLGAAVGGAPEVKKATGEVTFICPKHKAIKLKTGEQELMLFVYGKCPNKEERMKETAALEVGQAITASYFQHPESRRLFLTRIETKVE